MVDVGIVDGRCRVVGAVDAYAVLNLKILIAPVRIADRRPG
jgi:hypothetical protein